MNNKISILTLALTSCIILAQEKEISYVKDGVKVTEKDNWEYKIVQAKSSNKNNETLLKEKFDKDGILLNKTIIEQNIGEKKYRILEEVIYNQYNCKTIKELIIQNEKTVSTEKCLDLKDKIIFADKPCEEIESSLGKEFYTWVQYRMEFVEDKENKIRYVVNFTVKTNYEIVVTKINGKNVDEKEVNLSYSEKKTVEIIKKIPPKFFEGKFRKIAGQNAEMRFSLPIDLMGSSY